MKLLIDFGNSRCKWAILENGVRQTSVAETYNGEQPVEIAANLIAALPIQAIDNICIASVLGPEFDQEFSRQVSNNKKVTPTYYVSQREAFGIRLAYDDPVSYGADRYAALVAAFHASGGAKIVVDCGTAVTVDAIDSQGNHLGGLIIPGVDLMCSMLAEKATGISHSDRKIKVQYLNASTHDAVVSGSTLCLQHGLRSIIAEIQRNTGQDTSIYITGGARAVLKNVEHDQLYERPDLVLEGLEIMQSS